MALEFEFFNSHAFHPGDPEFFRWIEYLKKKSPLANDHFILACKAKFQPLSDRYRQGM